MKFSNTVTSALATAVFGFATLGLTSTPAVALPTATTVSAPGFTVSATVLATCSITADGLSFGTYLGAKLDVSSNLYVTCTNSTPYDIGLSAGGGGAVGTRKMKGTVVPGNTLAYSLFYDSARSKNWGVTINSDTLKPAGGGTGSVVTIPVYGEIAAGLFPVADTYSDTIVASVTY